MGGANEFLGTVRRRELAINARLFSNDPILPAGGLSAGLSGRGRCASATVGRAAAPVAIEDCGTSVSTKPMASAASRAGARRLHQRDVDEPGTNIVHDSA